VSRRGAVMVLALAIALLLAACGSSKTSGPSSVQVPSVVHVGRYTQMFAGPLPGKPAAASVIEGFREGEVQWERSANAGHVVPQARDYVTGRALTDLTSAVTADSTDHRVPAGVDRLFLTRVTALTGHTATVVTCDDGSKFTEVNPRTGEVDATSLPTPGEKYLFETWRMAWFRGHWAISGLTLAQLPSRAAEPCQPGVTGSGPARPGLAVLLRQMRAAVQAAGSVHVAGTVRQGGKTVGLSLSMTRPGGVFGQVSEAGATLTVLLTGGHGYLKITSAFLKEAHLPAAVCGRLCGNYFAYPGAPSQLVGGELTMASLTHSITSAPSRGITLLGAVSFDGEPAWLLQDSKQNSIFLAARGRPYVLGLVSAPPGDDTLTFSQWDAAHVPGPPPASRVVRPSQLSG